ncbi:MAG: acetate--CoA ligase family protein [Nocardioidaceae bacterium]
MPVPVPVPGAGIGERDLKVLLAEAGLPVPTGRLATDGADAAAAVTEVGGRAVLKAVVPGLTHKSEAGGVALDVTPEDAAQVYDRLAALGGEVLVEELVGGGVEALVGVAASPLGPVLTVGVGGVLTELLDDVALRLLPVGRADVEQLVDETRLGTLLSGTRGAEPSDRDAFVDLVLDVAALVETWPAGFELDLNPVSVAGHGVRILDAAYVAPEGS